MPIRPSREDVITLLSALVEIDSINPSLVSGAAGESAIAAHVAHWLEEAGLVVEVVEVAPGRPNVIARLVGRAPGRTLMLNAHVDTVGIAGMDAPFRPRVEGNRLYGRGSYDMKGSLAAIMLTARLLKEAGLPSGEVVITAVADEEYASLGTESIVASVNADAAIVTEPTGAGWLCTAHRGFAWLSIETKGRAAHGSKPELGVDAIAHMGRVLGDLEAFDQSLRGGSGHPLLGTGSLHASIIEGGQELSSYPERCRLQVERRTVPGDSRESVLAEIEAMLARRAGQDAAFEGHTELFFWRDPFEVERGAEIVGTVERAIETALGQAPVIYGDTPWMDAALLSAAGIPTVVYGPGGAGAHAAVEYSNIDEVISCTEVLVQTALDFCGSA